MQFLQGVAGAFKELLRFFWIESHRQFLSGGFIELSAFQRHVGMGAVGRDTRPWNSMAAYLGQPRPSKHGAKGG